MDKRLWLAGFSLGLLLLASACSEVDNCEPGADGCIGGRCASDSDCEFKKLQCVSIGARTVCAEELALTEGGGFYCGEDLDCKNAKPVVGSGDGDGDGNTTTPCSCTGIDELCVPGTTDQCLNYCADPGFELSVTERRQTEQLPCRRSGAGTPVSYEEACKAALRQFCLRSEVYCTGFTCPPNLINTPEAQVLCMETFPVFEDLASWCEGMRDGTCANFAECDNTHPKSCATPVVCSSTCPGNPEFANDGACDDGDIATAAFAECEWGTDCGDCGPRVGTPPALPIAIGAPCVSNIQCIGNSEDLRRNQSWCLAVNPGNLEHRCMADCTRDGVCPEGYTCVGIEDGNGEAIVQGDLEAGVCNPMICQ